MATRAVIITSCIEVNNAYPLTYSAVRSKFSNEERLRQTIQSVASIDQAMGQAGTTIYLVDASLNYQQYQDILGYQSNLEFISVLKEFPEIIDQVRSHPNKTLCECTMLKNFFERYSHRLAQHDFIFKFSGRYFLDGGFDSTSIEQFTTNTIFFKKPMEHEWQDWWGYDLVDRRHVQGNSRLYQYSTVLFGFGNQQINNIVEIFGKIVDLLLDQKMLHYDMETLMYFLTRSLSDDIVETDWRVYGFQGPDGRFLRY
jgi:hypothetical protein